MFRSIMVVFAFCGLVIPPARALGQDGGAATRPVIRPAPVSTATRPAIGTRPAMNFNPRPPLVGTRPAPDELAFTLDGKKFTEGDLEKWLRKVLPSGPQAPGEDQITMMLQRARTQLINLIVDDEFLQAAARKNNALITPEDIDAGVEKRVQAVLKAQNISRQEFDERIRQSGSTLDQQIAQLKTNYYQLLLPLQQEKLGRVLFKDVQVSEQELKDYYADPRMAQRFAAQVRASHILIKPSATAPADMPAAREAARKKAEAVLAQAKAPGADFAALAQA
ncbi:MAG: peptidylprolyl isomerase, partial [Phycisphaerae bacterium]